MITKTTLLEQHNVQLTDDLDDINDTAIMIYTSPDRYAMEVYQDGKMLGSHAIGDFCDDHPELRCGYFDQDKELIYNALLQDFIDEEWLVIKPN